MITSDWTCVTRAAEWEPRDSCAEFAYNDHLWIMGGWFHQSEPNPRDVWKSADGKHWEKVLHEAPWEKSDLPGFCVHNGRMWHMGGRRLPGTECSRDVYSTTNGVDWDCATHDAGWSARLGMGCISFQDRIWIFGGTASFYDYNEATLKNDIWSSDDGIAWTLECDGAPWAKRAYHKVVELNGKLYLTAGGGWKEWPIYNDVWCSDDGIHWDCLTDHAPWWPRIWHGSAVYRDCIWVIAGEGMKRNGAPDIMNDVWFSRDGVAWQPLRSNRVFSPRHEVTTYVFQDKLWVAAGHAHPLSNEVWSLTLTDDSQLTSDF